MIAHISKDNNREESVKEHTEKTRILCEKKGKRCGMENIMSLCAILHDIGKEKKAFEDYLNSEEDVRKKLRGSVAHASTGAKYLYDRYHEKKGNQKILVELMTYCIAAHHGLFDCVNGDGDNRFMPKITQVDSYEEACENAQKDFLKEYNLDKYFEYACQEFNTMLLKIQKISTSEEEILFYVSCIERLMLSIMIDSDWEATAAFMNNEVLHVRQTNETEAVFEEAFNHFDQYMNELHYKFEKKKSTDKEKEINKARDEMQKECRDFAKYQTGIYCLPLPTGGGKTLSGLAYALEYCKEHKQIERIIYISPYISITEQNSEVFRKAIGKDEWILEHHSAVVKNLENDNEDYQTDQLSQLDVNWEEPFICTTFVQFMNTLFSDKKQCIRRMHRLVNAVIVIDEVQSMPIKCIHTFNSMMNFLNAVCNTDIVLCTATQPKLEKPKHAICYSQPKNMIQNVNSRFSEFERVVIKYQTEKYSFEKLKNEIMQKMERFDSMLVVLNTKASVRKLYDLLKNENIKVVYLTTNLCAEHRKDRLEYMKGILKNNQQTEKKEKIIVVSTNLIEAGVDISFECVYRSLTGLDSIAQTAGRCNRNGEREYGEVYIVDIKEENIGSMDELREARHAMEDVLHEYRGENSLLSVEWMDKYFGELYAVDKLKDRMDFTVKEIGTNIYDLLVTGFPGGDFASFLTAAFKTAGEKYKVIDNASFGVIVPYKDGISIIEKLKEVEDICEVKKLIRQAQRYTVNINGTQMKQLEDLLESVSEYFSGIYMPAVPGVYKEEYGLTGELETFII